MNDLCQVQKLRTCKLITLYKVLLTLDKRNNLVKRHSGEVSLIAKSTLEG